LPGSNASVGIGQSNFSVSSSADSWDFHFAIAEPPSLDVLAATDAVSPVVSPVLSSPPQAAAPATSAAARTVATTFFVNVLGTTSPSPRWAVRASVLNRISRAYSVDGIQFFLLVATVTSLER